jgi:hypothetical protein
MNSLETVLWLQTEGVHLLRDITLRITGQTIEQNLQTTLCEFTYIWKISDDAVKNRFKFDATQFPRVLDYMDFIDRFDKTTVDSVIDHIINLEEHKKALRQFCEYCYYDPLEYILALEDSNYQDAFTLFDVISPVNHPRVF